MADPSLRLEQALRYWEDIAFLIAQDILLCRHAGRKERAPLSGPLLHATSFRQAVLRCHEKPFDPERFLGDTAILEEMGSWNYLPSSLWGWSRDSRRLYHLNAELQDLFLRTETDGIRWEDLSWPFKSFGIQLATPISIEKNLYDTVLVAEQTWASAETAPADPRNPSSPSFLQVLLLGPSLETYGPVPKPVRQEIGDAIRRRNINQAAKLLNRAFAHLNLLTPAIHFHLELDAIGKQAIGTRSNILIRSSLLHWGERIGKEAPPGSEDPSLGAQFDPVIRVMVGLLVYLSNRPPASHLSPPRRPTAPAPGQSPRFITSEAEICETQGAYHPPEEAPQEERRTHRPGGYEVSPHHREGYYRRRSGEGNNPDAPRVIWVPPTTVRKDLLPPGALPLGSKKALLPAGHAPSKGLFLAVFALTGSAVRG
jgi:hypothetical protein